MIEKDIKRLAFTISKGNKPNQNDAEALNGVIEYVNDEKKRHINNYHLFAKLFVNVLRNDLIRNDYDYRLITNSLDMVLRMDLEEHIEGLVGDISQNELLKDVDGMTEDDILENVKFPKFNENKMRNKIIDLIGNLVEDYG